MIRHYSTFSIFKEIDFQIRFCVLIKFHDALLSWWYKMQHDDAYQMKNDGWTLQNFGTLISIWLLGFSIYFLKEDF